MPGNAEANYKRIQRFLSEVDWKEMMLRLFQADAPFVIDDPTEMPRPHAYKTPYVGKLKDGKTRGYWLLLLATPFRGRAIPYHFITYSSKTIALEETSRNIEHRRACEGIRGLLGMTKLMNKQRQHLEQMIALLLLTYVIGLRVGEALRDHLYGGVGQREGKGSKRLFYSGLFILLRQKMPLPALHFRRLLAQARSSFRQLVHAHVRSPV